MTSSPVYQPQRYTLWASGWLAITCVDVPVYCC